MVTAGIQILTSAFGGLEPVVDFVEQKISALTTAFQTITGGIGGFVGALFSGKSIMQAYDENLSGLTTTISKAFVQAENLKKAVQDLEDAESNALVTSAKNNKQVAQLLIQAKDRTKTEQERLDLLAKAGKIELANFENERSLALQREKIANAELALIQQSKKDQGEALKAARQATAERIQLESSFIELKERITNRENVLKEQAKADAEKSAEERKKVTSEELSLNLKLLELYYQKRENKIAEAEAEELKNGGISRQKQKELDKERTELKAEQLQAELDLLTNYVGRVDGIETQLRAKSLEADKHNAQEKIRVRKLTNEEVIAIEQATYDASKSFAQGTADLISILADQNSEALEAQKIAALFQIGVDTAQAISALVRESSQNPFNSISSGAAGIAQFIQGFALITANIAKAKALLEQEAPKANVSRPSFYEGGYTGEGNAHQESLTLGNKPYTYHKDEYVIPSKVLNTEQGAKLAAEAEKLRVSYTLPTVNLRGFYGGGLASNGAVIDYNKLANALSKVNITPVVNVKEITAMQNKVARVQDKSSL